MGSGHDATLRQLTCERKLLIYLFEKHFIKNDYLKMKGNIHTHTQSNRIFLIGNLSPQVWPIHHYGLLREQRKASLWKKVIKIA